MKIVDGMGGDHAPGEIIKGCIEAVFEYDDLSLTGDSQILREELKLNT